MWKQKKPLTVCSLIVLLAFEFLACPICSFGSPEAAAPYERPVFQKGLSYSAWSSDAFSDPESDESLRLLTETDTEWISVCLAWAQSSTTSHDIRPDPERTPTTESVRHVITEAHRLGLKVMLKPMVDTLEEETKQGYPTVWRGEIQPSDEWFESYSEFINFFAEFAEQNSVELFSVGCEFKATTGEKAQWENVIAGVRERYSGPITYAADWTNFQDVEWWDSLDYVGIDAYFPLTLFKRDPTVEELKAAWANYADEIEEWLQAVNKPVIFTEIGYRSGDGTSMAPSNYWSDMAVDLQEQHDCYETAFQTLWNKSWFYGFYWWTWTHKPTEGGTSDSGHSPQNKPTQDLITTWYSKDRKVAVIDQTSTSATKSIVNEAQSVGFHVSWETGGDVVDAKVYVNGTEYVTNRTGWASFTAAYDTLGERSWKVTDVQHPEAATYKVAAETPRIVWDKAVVDVQADTASFGAIKLKIKIAYAIDGTSVTAATTVVNGKTCKETEPGVYETTLDSWSPLQQVTVTVDTADLQGQTWTTSTFHVMNTVLYLALTVAAVVAAVLLLKRRRRSPTQNIN